jgi:YD repeat-containing protein
MLTLLATLLAAPLVADTAAMNHAPLANPPIQLSLNSGGNYAPGGLVSVRVRTNDDGYLVVFRVDGDGQIRVLFPLDPQDDAFVRGGKDYELRGRDAHGTFEADDRGGNGMVYAALASHSLAFHDFSANGHWDYDALRLPDSTADAENALTAIVTRMTNREHFDYDALGYRVQDVSSVASTAEPGGDGYYPGLYDPYYNPRWRCLGCGWGYPGADFSVGFGYSPFWDPFLYSPWGYNYGYGYGNNWWYGGNYPVFVTPRPSRPLPPGTRTRPRPEPPMSGRGNVYGRPTSIAPSPRGRPDREVPPPSRTAAPPPSSTGTRARPRPSDFVPAPRTEQGPAGRPVFRQPSNDNGRPVFRQPSNDNGSPSYTPRPEQPRSRPVYREPPQSRSPQPSARPAPPPSSPRSAPPPSARSAPPPSSGGGGRPHGGRPYLPETERRREQ